MKPIEIIVCIIVIWVVITTGIDRLINPEKTETQLFLDIPKSIKLDFQGK